MLPKIQEMGWRGGGGARKPVYYGTLHKFRILYCFACNIHYYSTLYMHSVRIIDIPGIHAAMTKSARHALAGLLLG